jgi:uncharacterized protein involved in outer membrane biogenesis
MKGRDAILLIIFYLIIAIFIWIFTDPNIYRDIIRLIKEYSLAYIFELT